MAVLADVVLETPVLRAAIRAAPGVEVDLEQQAITESMGAMWLLWAEGDVEAFEDGLESDPTVREFTPLVDAGDRQQYRVTLSGRGTEATVYPCWADAGGVFVAGRRTPGTEEWHLRFRFPDNDAVGDFLECCRRRSDVEASLERAVNDDLGTGPPYGLTERQVEVLRTAERRGYFEVPRSVTLPELAGELGTSDTAASESLRRGIGALIRNTLRTELDADGEG